MGFKKKRYSEIVDKRNLVALSNWIEEGKSPATLKAFLC
jgi:hypothetical protein